MFCPGCSAYLTEKDLIKTSVKYAPGNVPIEYEARCPECRCEMGIVSWGQLTVNPELQKAAGSPAPAKDVPNKPSHDERISSPDEKCCPHCGKPLPEGF